MYVSLCTWFRLPVTVSCCYCTQSLYYEVSWNIYYLDLTMELSFFRSTSQLKFTTDGLLLQQSIYTLLYYYVIKYYSKSFTQFDFLFSMQWWIKHSQEVNHTDEEPFPYLLTVCSAESQKLILTYSTLMRRLVPIRQALPQLNLWKRKQR